MTVDQILNKNLGNLTSMHKPLWAPATAADNLADARADLHWNTKSGKGYLQSDDKIRTITGRIGHRKGPKDEALQ